MRTVSWVFLMLGALGCGHPKAAEPTPNSAASTEGCLPDPKDRCPSIPDGCPGLVDEDGCPDISIHLGADCHLDEPAARTLTDVAQHIRDSRGLTILTIVSGVPACANVVREDLQRRGVELGRLETKTGGGDASVFFEVAAWNGAKCSETKPR